MTDQQGLPDVQSLAALANEMFQALPNAESFVTELRSRISNNSSQTVMPKPQSGFTPESQPSNSQSPIKSVPDYSFNEYVGSHPVENLQIDDLASQVKLSEFGLPLEDDLKQLLAEDRFVVRKQPAINKDFSVPHHLESNAGNYHQQHVTDDRLTPNHSRLPGELDVQQLLAAEFTLQKFNSPAAPTSQNSSNFYFLDSTPAPVFGNQPKQGQFAAESQGFDVQAIRRDFPILSERINGKPLVWFDNAATTHKPKSVIDRVSYFYEHENSNIHRAAHELAARATDAYEGARNKVFRRNRLCSRCNRSN
jgi:cysteine desulfurase / selenocysteine lyase